MSDRGRNDRPIGYWLKRADEAITHSVNEALGGLGLTRLHWQALAIIRGSGMATAQHLQREMRDFVGPAELDGILGSLEARGWLSRRPDPGGSAALELTGAGTRGHADALEIQAETRRRTMAGVSEDEYRTLVQVLQRIVANLQPESRDAGSP